MVCTTPPHPIPCDRQLRYPLTEVYLVSYRNRLAGGPLLRLSFHLPRPALPVRSFSFCRSHAVSFRRYLTITISGRLARGQR
jgi:hypothetical protein